jgi:flavin-dependent dehydrogenase
VALAAGAEFQAGARVSNILHESGGVSVEVQTRHGSRGFGAQAAVIAVGANMSLLRSLDLLPTKPVLSVAARRYYKDLPSLDRNIHIRFDGIPLPGYGWIFPLSEHEANVGAGFMLGTRSRPASAPAALDAFLRHPPVNHQIVNAHAISSTSGFPLRSDFHHAPTHRGRMLLVGEAAGLVNPFTGEGIDYALESGELAASALLKGLSGNGALQPHLKAYDQSLRHRFQETFVLTHWLRRIYMRPLLLDSLIRACRQWPQLGHHLIRVLLAYESPRSILTMGTFLRVLWAGLRPTAFT